MLLNKTLSMIWSPVIKDKRINFSAEFTSWREKWMTERLSPNWKSILWDKILKAKNKLINYLGQETTSYKNGRMSFKET